MRINELLRKPVSYMSKSFRGPRWYIGLGFREGMSIKECAWMVAFELKTFKMLYPEAYNSNHNLLGLDLRHFVSPDDDLFLRAIPYKSDLRLNAGEER